MAGLIICGYPGVGKSSIGGWYNCIDLESSYFSKGWDGSMVNILQEPLNYVKTSLEDEVKTLRIPSWVSCYADVGMDLADQGYTVLMSTHKDVLDFLEAASKAQETYGDEPIRPVIFCPKPNMKSAWIERLLNRYNSNGSPKNYRALKRVQDHFDTDIQDLLKRSFPVWNPLSSDYDLKTYISVIRDSHQNWRERNGYD